MILNRASLIYLLHEEKRLDRLNGDIKTQMKKKSRKKKSQKKK